MKALTALLILALVLAGSSAHAGTGNETVTVYADDAIYSYDCDMQIRYYYPVDGSGLVRLSCDGPPAVLAYGFHPPRARAQIIFQTRRTDDPLADETRFRCGLLMVDDEAGGTYLALDCRSNARPAASARP